MTKRLSIKKYGLVIFLALCATCFKALATTDHAATEQVAAQLLVSADAVYPGEKIWIGLQQKIIPHWHTYWINPGDSGLPTKITWQLPSGASADEIQWPTPTRFDQEGVTNYGYADEVILLTPISLPANLPIGKSIAINASPEWLACADICIPQKVELALDIPVVAAGTARSTNTAIENALAQLPQSVSWQASVEAHDKSLQLRIQNAAKPLRDIRDLNFFADTWGRVEHAAKQTYRSDGDDLVIELKAGDSKLKPGDALNGILKTSDSSGKIHSFIINAPLKGGVAPAQVVATHTLQSEHLQWWSAALFALLGGVVLNLMPCVFPVLSIKALALIKHRESNALQNRLHGLSYTIGVLASFLLLALLLIALKAGGAQFGWGFQYQSPLFVVGVAYLLFAVGLNLSGVFEFGTSIAGAGSNLANKAGYTGSFFTGVLAAIVATPCTAPFMGAAIGFALSQPPLSLITLFLSLGFGLALPYLLLSFWPSLQKRLPKPGRWMETLKQILAFPMYAAAVWLIWVLAQQTSADTVAFALGGAVAIALAAWLYQNSRAGAVITRAFGAVASLVILLAAIASSYVGVNEQRASTERNARVENHGENNYSAERLQQLRAQGKPVFVNFTAAWCISCLVNERVALKKDAVVTAFAQQGIAYLKGDWTNRDNEISEKLAEFGRSGVPLYLYFPPQANSEPVVLPQILTPDIVLSAIASANHKVSNSSTKTVTSTQQP